MSMLNIDVATMIEDAVLDQRLTRAVELHERLLILIELLWERGFRSSEIANVMRCVIADHLGE
jgi:hypothetical protein